MTNREFYAAILTADVADDIKNFATEAIAKLDAQNEKRSSKPSKTASANEPIKASIVEFLTPNKVAVASDIAVALDISTQKASALCRQLVESGVLSVKDTKVPKKGTLKAYSLAVKVD